MLGFITGFKTTIIASAVALMLGFGSGVWVRDAFCDSARAKLQVKNLNAQVAIMRQRIATSSKATEEDRKRAEADAVELARLQKMIDETPPNDTSCLDDDAAGRIGEVR